MQKFHEVCLMCFEILLLSCLAKHVLKYLLNCEIRECLILVNITIAYVFIMHHWILYLLLHIRSPDLKLLDVLGCRNIFEFWIRQIKCSGRFLWCTCVLCLDDDGKDPFFHSVTRYTHDLKSSVLFNQTLQGLFNSMCIFVFFIYDTEILKITK